MTSTIGRSPEDMGRVLNALSIYCFHGVQNYVIHCLIERGLMIYTADTLDNKLIRVRQTLTSR